MGVRGNLQPGPGDRRAEQRSQVRSGSHRTSLHSADSRISGQINKGTSGQSIRRRVGCSKVRNKRLNSTKGEEENQLTM
jgi:hypothetical protein